MRDAEGQLDGAGGQERKSQAWAMRKVRPGTEGENGRALGSRGLSNLGSHLLLETVLEWQSVL